jgi:polysaccharide export outer membrane protein
MLYAALFSPGCSWAKVSLLSVLSLAGAGLSFARAQAPAPARASDQAQSQNQSSTTAPAGASGTSPQAPSTPVKLPDPLNQRIQELASIAAASHPSETTLGAGDLIHVDVFDVPDLSRDVRVNSMGEVSLPLIPGQVPVAGLSPYQAQEKFGELLKSNGIVAHPQVTVTIKEQTSAPVSLVGAVTHPFVYQVARPTTLLELIAMAGGLSPDAGDTVIITRPAPAEAKDGEAASTGTGSVPMPQNTTIHLKDLLESGDSSYNVYVHGGEVVTVPRAGIVYIAGAVVQPGGYVLNNASDHMTTMKALALAHGLISSAKPDHAVILRKDDMGKRQEIDVPLKQIMDRKSEDYILRADDILFVPDSAGKRALYRMGEAVLAATTGAVVLRAVQ